MVKKAMSKRAPYYIPEAMFFNVWNRMSEISHVYGTHTHTHTHTHTLLQHGINKSNEHDLLAT